MDDEEGGKSLFVYCYYYCMFLAQLHIYFWWFKFHVSKVLCKKKSSGYLSGGPVEEVQKCWDNIIKLIDDRVGFWAFLEYNCHGFGLVVGV